MRATRRIAMATALLASASVLAGCRSGPIDGVVDTRPAAAASDPAAAAAALQSWTTFPTTRSPRPLVVLQPDVVDPASGFPDGDTKVAYLDHRIRISTSMPATPTRVGAYAVIPASHAIAELTGDEPSSDTDALAVTDVAMADHVYSTDRGDVRLPAWAVTLAGVADRAFVLAVSPDARFAHRLDPASWQGTGNVAARGNQLTFAFTPHHDSTGPCDPATTSRVALTETPTAVQLAIITDVDPPSAAPSSSGPVSCGLVAIGSVDPPLVPGTPGTTTQTLADELGNRPIVDEWGTPWKVAVIA